MSKGITQTTGHIWRGIARVGGWFSAQRVATDWAGIYELDEITEHLKVLQRGGFLETKPTRRDGAVYAYTVVCKPLPGETLVAVTPAAADPAAAGQVATPR